MPAPHLLQLSIGFMAKRGLDSHTNGQRWTLGPTPLCALRVAVNQAFQPWNSGAESR